MNDCLPSPTPETSSSAVRAASKRRGSDSSLDGPRPLAREAVGVARGFATTLRAIGAHASWIAVAALLPTSARAQILVHEFHGDGLFHSLGIDLAAAGDVDGDGFDDVVASAGSGRYVRVYSGQTGIVLRSWSGPVGEANFGRSVDGAGDVDGDGFDDVVVGNPDAGVTGAAIVYSGQTGGVLWTFLGGGVDDDMGAAVAGLGDVNGDGHADVAVAATQELVGPGYVEVRSGLNGSVLWAAAGLALDDLLGTKMASAGDVNGDGVCDLIVAANVSYVRLYSGSNGALLQELPGNPNQSAYGHSLSGAGDVDGDGFDDFVIGDFLAAFPAANPNDPDELLGAAYVHSGATGALLRELQGPADGSYFGWDVGAAGDVNADGRDDVLVGAYREQVGTWSSGSVRVYSGADWSELWLLHDFDDTLTNPGFGNRVAGLGDVDGDSVLDVAVAVPQDDVNGVLSGSVLVYGLGGAEIELTRVDGLRSAAIGSFTEQTDPHEEGRIFLDTDIGGELLMSPDEERVRLEVELRNLPLALLDHYSVRWELYDPDDPADSPIIDGNGPAGGDNTGTPHESTPFWFEEADHAFLGTPIDHPPVDESTAIGEAESEIVVDSGDGVAKSSVILDVSDDGGDNFRVKAVLVKEGLDVAEDESATFTVWRYRVLEDYAMQGRSYGGWFPGSDYRLGLGQGDLAQFYSTPGPDHLPYLEVEYVEKGVLPYDSNLQLAEIAIYMDSAFTHAIGKMSLLGVFFLKGSGANHGDANRPPHAVVAMGWPSVVANGFGTIFSPTRQFKRTAIHEISEVICERHVSKLRDRAGYDFGSSHDHAAVILDSDQTR